MDPIPDEGERVLYHGVAEEPNRPQCRWSTVAIRKYGTEEGNRAVYQPPMSLVTLHDDNAQDGSLLLGELASLAQALCNRLKHRGLRHTSIFPVGLD